MLGSSPMVSKLVVKAVAGTARNSPNVLHYTCPQTLFDFLVCKDEISRYYTVPRPIMWRDIPIITLYYNRGCSYGPFLIGKRMHTLHLQIGPGPLRYVLREFIRMLVNCHRSPPGALRMMAELGSTMNESSSSAADSPATTPPNGTVMPLEAPVGKSSLRHEKIPLEMLYREKVLVKAKMKPRSETRAVPIVSQVWLVPDFVRQICILFQACPSLYTVDKRPPDTECKESCDTFVKPNPRAAAYRRTARRTAGVGGGASTANLSTALTASNSSINNSSAVNKRAQRIDFASKSLQNAVCDDIAVDADADEDADANAEAASSQQGQQVPEAPTTRSTRNRAKVSYQLMDKGISGDARRQKFEDSYQNANTRPQPKDGANTTPSKRKRRIDDEENEANTSHEDEEEDRARNDADDMDYDQSVVDAENDDDVDENSMTISDVPDDNSEGAAGGKGKKRRSNFTKPKRGGNGRIQKKISSDLTQKSSGKLNFLSPKTPIGTPTNIAELQQQRKQRGGKRQKSGRAALTLAERNDRMFLRELSALASNNQQLPLSQRRRVAEAAAAAGKTFRSTISQVGAGQYYDDNRAQAWMEFWSQCDYLDKVYVDKVRAKDPRMWTSEDIELFLVPNYGKQVSDIFTSDGIDGSLLMRLDMLGLRTLRVPSNIVPELMLEIEKLKVAFMYCHGDELTPDEWTTLTEHCGGHGYED